MAKLNAPLFSFNASGQIAKALVYFGWKGIDVVRSYVVPSNPQTTLQTTQRNLLKAAVAKIHVAQADADNPLVEVDQFAYALLGSIHPAPRTWFNEAVKLWIDTQRDGKVPIIYADGTEVSKVRATIALAVHIFEREITALNTGKFYIGKSKTSLIHAKTGSLADGDYVYLSATDCKDFMTVGNTYYWQYRPDDEDPCEGANSGIYHFIAE